MAGRVSRSARPGRAVRAEVALRRLEIHGPLNRRSAGRALECEGLRIRAAPLAGHGSEGLYALALVLGDIREGDRVLARVWHVRVIVVLGCHARRRDEYLLGGVPV